ncbi:Phenolic glucoside malonyltransferase 2 [Platanthera guangdongensis]|uniref:Phenolic glucoside malonyltransferase 2 n=1 Tax=Platanthera guangdongensis TaxID=2320717 RepID=A0ABR2MSN2_9ASPA
MPLLSYESIIPQQQVSQHSSSSSSSKTVISMAAVIRVLQEIHVSPPPSLPSQDPQPLSFLDSVWLRGARVERLFFYDYPHPISHFIDNHLPAFTESLSLTLLHFHPLAGTIRRSPLSDYQFEIAYTEGDFVGITIAEFVGEDFQNISGHHLRDLNKLRLLVPKPPKSSLDGEAPPLSVQVTLFPNQGLCIGFTVNHAVCDGSGSMRFIRSWAAACRSAEGELDISPPLLDRSIVVDSRGLGRKTIDIARKIREIYPEKLKKQGTVKSSSAGLVSGTYTLGKDQIARLKKQVQRKTVEEGTPPFHMSTFVVTCAYVLRCVVKARGYDDDDDRCVFFSCAVDWRQRMMPPIPSNYFGNCVGPCSTGLLKAGKISGKDGFGVAAMEIGRSIDELKGKDVAVLLQTAIDKFMERVESVDDTPPLSVAGSPKLRVYETDFGWGRPGKVEVTSIGDTGAMSLAESREEEGGVEIGLALPEEVMEEFGKHFAGGLLDIF